MPESPQQVLLRARDVESNRRDEPAGSVATAREMSRRHPGCQRAGSVDTSTKADEIGRTFFGSSARASSHASHVGRQG